MRRKAEDHGVGRRNWKAEKEAQRDKKESLSSESRLTGVWHFGLTGYPGKCKR